MSFEDNLKVFKGLQGKIPEKIRQKLKFLKFSIKNHENEEIEVNPEKYPDLEVEEIEGLFRLPVEAQKSMFLSVFKSLELDDESIIKGELHSKGETLGLWKVKKLELNLTLHRLKILRQEGIVEMHLNKYAVLWVGQRKAQSQYYCFTMMATNPKLYDHYKNLTMGSDDEVYAKKWFNLINKACEGREAPNRRMSVENGQLLGSTSDKQSSGSPPVLAKSQEIVIPSSKVPETTHWISNNERISTDCLDRESRPKTQFEKINESPEIRRKPTIVQTIFLNPPEYLKDLRLERFQEGQFNRCGGKYNIYKSISKSHLYQLQIEIEGSLEEVIDLFVKNCTWNKYLVEQPFYQHLDQQYNHYNIWKQRRSLQYQLFHKECYIMRYRGLDMILEKQLDSTDPMFNIIKFTKQSNTILIQILSYLKLEWLNFNNEIPYLEQYFHIQSHLHFIKQFKSIDFDQLKPFQINSLTSSSSDNQNEEFFQEILSPNQVPIKQIPLTFKEILQMVEQNQHFAVCIDKQYQLSPLNVEPKYQKSGPNGHFLFKYNWKIDTKSGGLLYVDENGIKEQKKVFSYIISKIGGNFIEGKSIMNVSLPVNIFEKQSNLSRYASTLTYLQYLDRSVGKDVFTQIRNFIPYGLTTVVLYINMQKPFNPILGETYQGFINGCPVFAEQVSHHPPISSIILYGKGYKVYQRLCTLANISANSVTGINQGYTKVVFDDGNEYIFLPCVGTYYGTLYGDKLFQLTGKFHVIDLKNKYVAEMKLNPTPSTMWKRQREHLDDYYEGRLCKVTDEFITRFRKEGFTKYKELKQNEIVQGELMKIHGVWHSDMYIDGEQIWNFQMEPYQLENEEYPLASDANWREDLLAWKMDDFELAMRMKTKLEEIQRSDAKLRKQKKH